jgi:hypothetical protein
MNEFLYGIDSIWIAAALFVGLLLLLEIGYRLGRLHSGKSEQKVIRDHVNAIQAGILGILGLLLAFTLSLALQKFGVRSTAVVDEASAIGTVWLRADLLKPSRRDEARELLRSYIALRVQEGQTMTVEEVTQRALYMQALRLQEGLWAVAVQSTRADANAATSGLFSQAVNGLIDQHSLRTAMLDQHVPEVVLLLLDATFLLAAGIVGYAAGVAGHRPASVSYVLILLIVLLVFLTLDLDRPRRGLIQVSQQPMLNLQAELPKN